MLRRPWLLITTVLVVAAVSADAYACGDKFLRVGRSARFRRYASVHPSAILIYAPKWTGTGISEFEAMLKRAGHKPLTVTTEAALSDALASAKYDMVISAFVYAAAARDALESVGSSAAVLPVVYQPSKGEDEQAKAMYPILLRPEKMTR